MGITNKQETVLTKSEKEQFSRAAQDASAATMATIRTDVLPPVPEPTIVEPLPTAGGFNMATFTNLLNTPILTGFPVKTWHVVLPVAAITLYYYSLPARKRKNFFKF